MMSTDELLTSLFDGQPHSLASPMAEWLGSSRRFASFVTTHHTKIRKKLRSVKESESLRDLMLELETAYLLLREQALSVAYEPQHSQGGRSPDFAVSFTTSFTFMVEATRLRPAQPKTPTEARESSGDLQSPAAGFTNPLPASRFTDIICSKLGQLLPQRSNVLVVGMEPGYAPQIDANAVMLRVQQRAEANDSTILHRYGIRDRADFFRHYRRLSAILLRAIPLPAGEPAALWVNPRAKHQLPARTKTAIVRSHTL